MGLSQPSAQVAQFIRLAQVIRYVRPTLRQGSWPDRMILRRAYVKQNFQYAILENYNAKIDDKVVLQRESWWKETLQSRSFGYNKN